MSSEIQARVVDRFVATGKSDEPWAHIVLAAMESADQLDAFLDKKTSIAPPQSADVTTAVAAGRAMAPATTASRPRGKR